MKKLTIALAVTLCQLLGIVNLQAATFLEGARDEITLHPSCRKENTGLTAVGVALPVGPIVLIDDVPVTFPQPNMLISTNRKGDVFDANPMMGTEPNFTLGSSFAMTAIQGTVAAYGRNSKTIDNKIILWKVKELHQYDLDSNTIQTLHYMPAGALITTAVGTALPKFHPDSCLLKLNIKGALVARCDQIDPDTKTVLTTGEADIRKKSMRLTIERDIANNPLPAHCSVAASVLSAESIIVRNAQCDPSADCSSSSEDKSSEITIESTEEDIEQVKAMLMKMKP